MLVPTGPPLPAEQSRGRTRPACFNGHHVQLRNAITRQRCLQDAAGKPFALCALARDTVMRLSVTRHTNSRGDTTPRPLGPLHPCVKDIATGTRHEPSFLATNAGFLRQSDHHIGKQAVDCSASGGVGWLKEGQISRLTKIAVSNMKASRYPMKGVAAVAGVHAECVVYAKAGAGKGGANAWAGLTGSGHVGSGWRWMTNRKEQCE